MDFIDVVFVLLVGITIGFGAFYYILWARFGDFETKLSELKIKFTRLSDVIASWQTKRP